MTKEEIKKEIEKKERALFYEEMADFMDWNAYHRLKREIRALYDQLDKLEEVE